MAVCPVMPNSRDLPCPLLLSSITLALSDPAHLMILSSIKFLKMPLLFSNLLNLLSKNQPLKTMVLAYFNSINFVTNEIYLSQHICPPLYSCYLPLSHGLLPKTLLQKPLKYGSLVSMAGTLCIVLPGTVAMILSHL